MKRLITISLLLLNLNTVFASDCVNQCRMKYWAGVHAKDPKMDYLKKYCGLKDIHYLELKKDMEKTPSTAYSMMNVKEFISTYCSKPEVEPSSKCILRKCRKS